MRCGDSRSYDSVMVMLRFHLHLEYNDEGGEMRLERSWNLPVHIWPLICGGKEEEERLIVSITLCRPLLPSCTRCTYVDFAELLDRIGQRLHGCLGVPLSFLERQAGY